jgi:hypothetical protein
LTSDEEEEKGSYSLSMPLSESDDHLPVVEESEDISITLHIPYDIRD